jgi:gliding motility-associated-like protein
MSKSLHTAAIILVFLFFCESSLFSQNKFKNFFSKANSVDSLAGFDEEYYKSVALEEGLSQVASKEFIALQKRVYIDLKYNLKQYFEEPIDPNSEAYRQKINNQLANPSITGKLIGGGNVVNTAPCVNEDFELNNMSGWSFSAGTNLNSFAYPATPNPVTFPSSSLQIITTPTTDPIIGAIANSPFTGNKVVRISDSSPNGSVQKINQTFPVTSSNFLYEFAYQAVSLQSPHTCSQQPYMRVVLKDFVGNILSCPNFTFASPNPTAVCSTTGITTWSLSGGVYRNPTWQKYSIDLTSYINSTITVEVILSDCVPTGHYMYAYFDSNCSQLAVTLNNTLNIPAPNPTVNVSAQCATTATLGAPGGLGPYLWNGPAGSGITSNTNQTIATTVAGDYTLSMNPPGSCLPIVRVVKLNFPPPTTITASPSPTICASGTNTQVTLSAFGAASYTWQPGNLVLNIVNVSPTVTTIYTITARTGTCVGDYTFQVNVSPDPVVNVLSSNLSVCPGQTATLTASGANTYSWLPVGLTGSLVTLTQTATTTYTTIGTSTAGCVSSATTAIVSTTLLPASVLQIGGPTGTICPGTSVTFVALNASTFTWQPAGFVGNPATFTPTVTTTYTAIGSSGSCTNSAVFTVTVDPGPSMTVTSSPTIICPGNSATLTSVSPTALSFTWAPVASSNSFVVVTPTAPTVYTVSGTNALGCVSRFTVEPIISPVPSLTISPGTPTVCFGSTLGLTASGASTYTWNPGALNGASISVAPISNTTYTIVGSNGTCTSSATSSVTVISLPPVTAGASTTAICVGSSLTLSAGGAASYTWNPGGLIGATVTVSPVASTFYTVTGSQGDCQNTATLAILVNSGSALNPVANPTAVCPGGSSALSASGATSYTWNPGALTGATVNVTPIITTNYTVSAINVFGCSSTATVDVLVNPTPVLSITASSSTVCAGAGVSYSVSGAASFTWNPGALTGSAVSFTPTGNTTYTVSGTSAFGCVGQQTVSVVIVANPTVFALSNPTVICNGSTATLSASGANAYTWSPGALSGSLITVSPSVNTTYTLTGETSGCLGTTTTAIAVLNSPTLNPVASPTAICIGGTSNLSSSGAISYTWNPGNLSGASVNVSPTITTTYSVTGNNLIGCLSTNTVLITVNPLPSIAISASSASVCAGNAVTYTASGATTYTWNPGGLTGAILSFTPLANTTYTVDGANAFGCTTQGTVAVTVVPNPTPIPSTSSSSICAGNSATLSALGASAYTWNPGALIGTPVTVSPTISTTYTVSGGSAGCAGTATILINVQNGPVLTAAASPTAVCPGGLSNLSSSGALTYTWNPGNLNGASVGVNPTVTTVYTVTGNNAIGCLSTRTVQVVVNPAPTVTVTASTASICAGSSLTLTASGAGFYTWNPGGLGGLSVVVSPSVTTTYTVTGTNGFGCTDQKTITILVVPIPNILPTASPNPICVGFSSTLSATGAVSYTWNPGNITTASVVVSPTVNTTYLVSGDNSGCIGNSVITVSVQTGPVLNPIASPTAICPGFTSNLSASGATSYTWNPGGLSGANQSVSPAATTIYTVTGASALGCLTSNTLQVVVNPTPNISISAAVPSICVGGFVGLVGGGAATYTWLPGGSTLSAISPVINATTTFTLIGTSSLSCVGQNTITIVGVPFPTVVPVSNPPAICVGGSATLSATGANSYTWFPGSATVQTLVVSPFTTTTYAVVGTASACSSSSTITVVVNSIPSVTAAATPTAICAGFNSTLSASGAASYTWNPGGLVGASVSVSPAFSTIYTVTGASAFGCVNSTTIQLTVNTPPSLTLVASSPSICSGGSVALVGLGGGAISYTWFPGNFAQNGITVSPTATTIYTAVGTNSAGCSAQTTIQVLVVPSPTVTAIANPTAICVGGSSTLSASGANTYLWSTGSSFSLILVNPSVTTTYTLLGNTGSCTGTTSVQVVVNPLPTVSVSASNATICSGASSTLTASGASSYTWLPGGSTATALVANPTVTTIYTLQAMSAAGCMNSSTFALQVIPVPTVVLNSSGNLVCSGTTLTLTATGANNYTWQPGATTGSNLVTTVSAITIYTVTGESASCQSSSTIGISVLALPVVNAAANPTAVCAGNSTTLSATGASSYTWLPMSLSGAVVTTTPTGPATYTVIGLAASGCSNTANVSVILVSPPTLSISPSTTAICSGSSVSLTASGAGNYTWQPGNQNSASIVQNPTITSTYTVLGSSGGCVGSQTIQILVNPLPLVTASISSASVCIGNSVSLSAGGAVSYTWSPLNITGSNISDTPTLSLTYTVTGQDANACFNTATVGVVVNQNPTLTASASPTAICEGATVSLSAAGANTYTWSPGNLTGALVNDSPLINTTYTVFGADANGCNSTATLAVQVIPNPTVAVSPQTSTICVGNSVTLTASGAGNYTWLPNGSTLTTIVESPTISTTYTLTGDNAGLCFNTLTAQIVVNPLPANVTTSVAGIISCAGPTVNLFGASTDTNVSYFWSGPLSYTSNVQNPTGVGFWGNYTLTVTDNQTGCITTVTVDVPTDFSIPSVTLSSTSSSITCAIPQVTLNAANTTTNPGFAWIGPGVVSGTTQAITTTVSGVFTVVVTDLTSSCVDTATISISTFTDVAITASISPATCNGTITNSDGSIYAFNFGVLDKFDLVTGSSYTGTATYITATGIPTNGILTNTLANPTSTLAYTIRFFDDKGCTKDTTLILTPTSCEINAFGIAKSIPSILTNDDGSYNVTVKTVVKNYGTVPLTEIKLVEDLNTVFAPPMTFTVVTTPSISSAGSSLVVNSGFDGLLETSLTNTLGSQIGVGKTDTILFTVRVTPFGRFGPFSNSIKGTANSSAVPSITIVLADSSQNGLDPDPNLDNNPANNNQPTTFSFTPKLFFGLTKTGEAIKSDNNTFDFRYTITVHNLGNDTLYNVNVKDSLYNSTVRLPASYNIRSGPSVSGNGQLVANSNFDGRNDVRVTNSVLSKMPPGTKSSVSFVVNVITDTVSIYKNSATGTAVNSQNILVSDTSGNGSNPDVNNNGIWNEPADNLPTVLVVSNPTLFIPQGFSPNGDGINETFVIKGLPDGENELIIYNRWGSKVYESSDYDNTWDGSANRGSNGNNKLPQGTYYYILNLKGTDQKAYTGFIVLQY